jgi:integrase
MRKKLTDLYVKTRKPPPAGRLVVVDTEVRGLALRITAYGTRSWLIRYRVKGEGKPAPQRSLVLERTTLAQARQRARDIIAAAKRGVDLVAEEKRAAAQRLAAAASARSIRELASEYVEKHCKPHQRRWRDTELRLRNHVLPTLGDKPVGEIRRADVVDLLDRLEHGKGLRQQVNRTRTMLSAMFRYAIERQYREDNPVTGTRLRKMEGERERVLDDAELKAIWAALDSLPDPGRSFVRLLMLTAARRDEVRGLLWGELDLDGALWLLPGSRNKSRRDFEIPLSKPAVAILRGLDRLGPHVLTVHAEGKKQWGSHGPFKADLDRESGITGWVFHDLRRTVRSRLAELRIPYEVAERVLNHAMTKIERTYNRHAYRDEKRKALEAWAGRLALIVGEGLRAPNVTELRARA